MFTLDQLKTALDNSFFAGMSTSPLGTFGTICGPDGDIVISFEGDKGVVQENTVLFKPDIAGSRFDISEAQTPEFSVYEMLELFQERQVGK